MKIRFLKASLVVATILLTAAAAQALYVDLRPNGNIMPTDGAAYTPGASLNLEVWLVREQTEFNIDCWAIDIWFDSNEVTYDRSQSQNILPGPGWFTISYPQNVIKDATPYVQNLEAFTLTEPSLIDPEVQAANLFFNVTTLVADGQPDFAVYYRPGQAIVVNADWQANPPTWELIYPGSIGPDLAAPVPLPGAVYLFGTGLLRLMAWRRREDK